MRISKIHIFFIFVIIAALLFGGYYYRTEIKHALWYRFRLSPPVTLLFGNDAALSVHVGNYYFNESHNDVYDLEEAEQYFNRALAIDPNVPLAWQQLARIDFLKGNFSGALEKINRQIEIHGDSQRNSHYVRGLIYGYSGQFEKAEADFLRFLEWKERSWAANNDLAWIHFMQGDYVKAAEITKRGLLYNPHNPWLLNLHGVSLLNLNRKEEARNALLRALAEAVKLTEEDWRDAYPGNDPRIAKQGLSELVTTIESNLKLTVD